MTVSVSPPAAALPMYDWPEIRTATDALWTAIADALCRAGLDAPDALDRAREPMQVWRDPQLLLAQTCGLPLSRHLMDQVAVVGVPAYRLPGVVPGNYCSRIVARRDDARARLGAFRGAVAAVNMPVSQSGLAALACAVAPLCHATPFFAAVQWTGAHRASVRAVAQGDADVAAIDAVSWELALRHEPAALALRVIASTPQTPGLPLITARRDACGTLAAAVSDAIDSLSADSRSALLLEGFCAVPASVYADFDRRCLAALRAGNTGLDIA
ncbi:MAG: PhnD/SsuA/transferrin family substrate-binding protein [Rhodobiaceae bacterium]|nr:PhnD/SsuA/transferrin family substrate-binding protein [Rhodobiaceae bacterium]MCC0042213.1 PhnD/SsuA/transferrin family substrate-binding protein [Rhodobiaceae bacterium]